VHSKQAVEDHIMFKVWCAGTDFDFEKVCFSTDEVYALIHTLLVELGVKMAHVSTISKWIGNEPWWGITNAECFYFSDGEIWKLADL
jgi:hypothetical protein